MKILLLILALAVLPGCVTTYEYTNGDQSLKIKSAREFPEGIRVQWDGEGFVVESGAVTNDGNEAMANALLQAMSLHGELKRCLLAFDADVIDANICLCASTNRCDATMFTVFCGQCDNGMFVERAYELGDGLAGLGDCGAGLEQDEVNDRGRIDRYF